MLLFKHACAFFFEIPRIEELQDPNSSPRREEVGRRTLRDYGGFLLPFFYRARFQFYPDTLGVEESSSPKKVRERPKVVKG